MKLIFFSILSCSFAINSLPKNALKCLCSCFPCYLEKSSKDNKEAQRAKPVLYSCDSNDDFTKLLMASQGIDPVTGKMVQASQGIDPVTVKMVEASQGIDPVTVKMVEASQGIDPVTGKMVRAVDARKARDHIYCFVQLYEEIAEVKGPDVPQPLITPKITPKKVMQLKTSEINIKELANVGLATRYINNNVPSQACQPLIGGKNEINTKELANVGLATRYINNNVPSQARQPSIGGKKKKAPSEGLHLYENTKEHDPNSLYENGHIKS